LSVKPACTREQKWAQRAAPLQGFTSADLLNLSQETTLESMTAQKTVRLLPAFLLIALHFLPTVKAPADGQARPAPRTSESPAKGGVLNWAKVEEEALQKLSEYVRVDTSNPPGNETRGVEWLKKVLDAEGIPYQASESAPGRGSLVARVKGSGQEPGLILLSHIDVVPANPEFWSVDPFAGTVREGYLWGRGTMDMKSQGIAQLMAFLLLHRAQVPLKRDVVFLATADEEAGGDFGAGWVVKNKPEWIAGTGFLLTEGARSVADPSGKLRYIGVGPTEKTPAWLKLTATGVPGHGSVPRPDSAVNRLLAALGRLKTYEAGAPLEVTPPIERALRSLALYEEEPWRSRLRDIPAFLRAPDARQELAKRPGLLALLHNTISITGLEGSQKINVIPPAATAWLDCRLLPGWSAERWVAEIRSVLRDDAIRVEVVLNFPPTESPLQTPLYAAIVEAVKELYPAAGVAESISTGFTDSHFFREKGIVSYGFGPFALTEGDSARAHGNDERIPVAAFDDGVRLTWEVVYGFVKAE